MANISTFSVEVSFGSNKAEQARNAAELNPSANDLRKLVYKFPREAL